MLSIEAQAELIHGIARAKRGETALLGALVTTKTDIGSGGTVVAEVMGRTAEIRVLVTGRGGYAARLTTSDVIKLAECLKSIEEVAAEMETQS